MARLQTEMDNRGSIEYMGLWRDAVSTDFGHKGDIKCMRPGMIAAFGCETSAFAIEYTDGLAWPHDARAAAQSSSH